MNNGSEQDRRVWSGTAGSPSGSGVELARRRRADRAAGARPAPQPQAGPSAGVERAGQARTAVAVRGLRRRVRARAPGAGAARRRGGRRRGRPRLRGDGHRPRPLASPTASALAPYLHSTRRPVAGVAPAGGFEEAHSHATSHLLLPEDPALLAGDGPLVLVDDEFSTGQHRPQHHPGPARALPARPVRRRRPGRHALGRPTAAGWRSSPRRSAPASTWWRRASGTVRLPDGVLEKGQELVAEHEAAGGARALTRADGRAAAARPADGRDRTASTWAGPRGLPDGGRHGFTPPTGHAWKPRCPRWPPGSPRRCPRTRRRVLVLGFEELMYAPLRLARELEQVVDAEVRFSTTTRSPVLAVDDPGYAIRSRLVFPAHDDPADGPGDRYAYNVAGARLRRRRRRGRLHRRHPRTARPRRPVGPAGRAHPARRCSRSSPRTSPTPRTGRNRHAARAPPRPRLLLVRARGGRLAAPGPLGRDAGGADRGARGGHPERRRALRRVAAGRVPAERAVPGAVPHGAGEPRRPGSRWPSAPSPRSCSPSASPRARCWSRWPAPARPSAS